MKKRILSSIVSVAMLLSLCSFHVNAQEALTLANYNVMSNAITLEFSGEVSEVIASVSGGGNTVSATASQVGDDAKVWNLKLDDKMDITNKYILDFTAVPSDAAAYTALSAREAITFNVLWNDDFSSYSSIDDVKKKYRYGNNGAGSASDSDTIWSKTTLINADGSTKSGLNIPGGNAALEPLGFGYGAQGKYGEYYTMEAEMSDFVGTAEPKSLYPAIKIYATTYLFGDADDYDIWWTATELSFPKSNRPFKSKNLQQVNVSRGSESTIAVSTFASTDSTNPDALQIAVNGDSQVYASGTLNGILGNNDRYVGLKPIYGTVTLNSLKMYKATMQDVSEFGIDSYEITSKFIKVNLTGEPATTPSASVVSLGDTLAVNTTVSDNTIVIKPASGSFPLDREILVSIPQIEDSYGQTVNVDKKFKLASLLTEDFESYTSIEQMNKYSLAFSTAIKRISLPEAAASDEYKDLLAINIEEGGNHRLQFNTKPSDCHAYFTFFQAYPKRLEWKDYILEFDVDTDIRDSRNQKQYAMNIIQTASGYNGSTGELYNGACKNVMRFEGAHNVDLYWSNIGYYKFGPKSASGWEWVRNTTPQGDASFIIGPQNNKTIAYLNNEVLYSDTYTPGSSSEGEFAFATNATTAGNTQYIDNIKAYKVEDLAASEVYVKTAAKSGNTISGKLYVINRDNTVTVPTKAIVAAYDSDNVLIGAKVLDVSAEQAAGSEIDYSVAIPETMEGAVTVRAFWWSGLDTMTPQSNSAVKTIN